MEKIELLKIEKSWVTLIAREDGTRNDYRFETKRDAIKWANGVGLDI